MLFEISLVLISLFNVLVTPLVVIKAYERGLNGKPTAVEEIKVKTPKQRKEERKNREESARLNKILDNINNYDGTTAKQEKI